MPIRENSAIVAYFIAYRMTTVPSCENTWSVYNDRAFKSASEAVKWLLAVGIGPRYGFHESWKYKILRNHSVYRWKESEELLIRNERLVPA